MLGIAQDVFADLSNSIDCIIHNGAVVHWLLPYAKMKPANVSGTVEVLRLAAAGNRVKPVHYVSTTSVFDSDQHQSSQVSSSLRALLVAHVLLDCCAGCGGE